MTRALKLALVALLLVAFGAVGSYEWMTRRWQRDAAAVTAKTDTVVIRLAGRIDTITRTVKEYIKTLPPPASEEQARTARTAEVEPLERAVVQATGDSVVVPKSLVPLFVARLDSLTSCRATVRICAAGLDSISVLQATLADQARAYQAKLAEKSRRAWLDRLKDMGTGALLAGGLGVLSNLTRR